MNPTKIYVDLLEEFRKKENVARERKLNRLLFDQLSFFEFCEKFANTIYHGKVTPVKIPIKGNKVNRVHHLLLSDLHFGADIKGDETGGLSYGAVEEARRFATIIREAARYKPNYRKNTRLCINLLGDIIENQLHDPRTGATVAEQCARAIHLLSQGIAYLASTYPEVDVYCATGNHDRRPSRHAKRAVHQKFDSYSTIIYYALKAAHAHIPTVRFHIPKTPFADYTVFSRKIGFTHGDTVLNPGNPYRSVNTKALEDQVNKFNAALKDEEEYAAILYGHTHIGHVVHLNNGTVLIGNGGLPPSDPFSVSLGSFESTNGQWIFESVPDHIVGDLRFLRCAPKYDSDKTLDKIIQPWPGF